MRFSHGVSWSQPMLFANAFDKSDLLNWIRRFRKHRVQLYCCAVAMVELGAARVAPGTIHERPSTLHARGALYVDLGRIAAAA
jgi:hypothetical protein